MDQRTEGKAALTPPTAVDRTSDTELTVIRTINGPAHLVFQAWTDAKLMPRWWVPKSFGITLLSCEMDARTGGTYRFTFAVPGSDQPMAFFGRYIEVTPSSRLVWTNEESGPDGSVTTVTFEERGGTTHLTLHDRYPSKAALDEAIASGSTGAFPEQFDALDALVGTLG